MNQPDSSDYSTLRISPQLVAQIVEALRNKAWGSVEIYVENYNVVQISQRTITKLRRNRENGSTQKQNNHITSRFALKIHKVD